MFSSQICTSLKKKIQKQQSLQLFYKAFLSLTESMVQDDLCINKHHLRRRTHDMRMCFCSIKRKIWHHRIFLMNSIQYVSRLSDDSVIHSCCWQSHAFCHLQKFRVFGEAGVIHVMPMQNACNQHASKFSCIGLCVCRCVVLSSWLRKSFISPSLLTCCVCSSMGPNLYLLR